MSARRNANAPSTRVIKLGGRAQGDAQLPTLLARAAAAAPLVVVHGGGDEVSAMQRRLGLEPTFVGGRRVTSIDDLAVVRMLLSGTVNKRLVGSLTHAGARAVGVSGEDGGLLSARVADPLFGRVGRDVTCDATLLTDLLAAGWLPVVSPLARERGAPTAAADARDSGLNVNGDDAAAAIAGAMRADELLFLADVDGVREGDRTLHALDGSQIDDLVARGVVQGGMRAKLEAARAALDAGVQRVRIGALAAINDPSAGTTVVATHPAARAHK